MLEILLAAEETASEAAINPILVGVIAFAILMILLFVTLAFGRGRDHT